MKDAYSPIYQEYLTAFQVGYHQMAELQVVCPCCREAVFRKEREYPTGVTAYFSHYGAAKAFSAECERRVASMSTSDKDRTNQESRNQSLQIFRAVLRDAVEPIPIKGKVLTDKDRSWQVIDSEYDLTAIMTMWLRKAVPEMGREELRNFTFTNAKRLLRIRGVEVSQTARPTIRSSIAADLLLSVVADHSHRTASYLAARSIKGCFEEEKFGKKEPDMVGWARTLQVALFNDPKTKESANLLVFLDHVLRELECLPFEKMITNAKKGLRPMQGVTFEDYLPKAENPEFQYALKKLDKAKVDEFDAKFAGVEGEFVTLRPNLHAEDAYEPTGTYLSSTHKL